MVRSSEAVTSLRLPSGAKARSLTASWWSISSRSLRPEYGSQMRTLPLAWPVAKTSSRLEKSFILAHWLPSLRPDDEGFASWLSGVPDPKPAELTGEPASMVTTWPFISLPKSSVLSTESLKSSFQIWRRYNGR